MRQAVALKIEATFLKIFCLLVLHHEPVYTRKYTKVITWNPKIKKKNILGKSLTLVKYLTPQVTRVEILTFLLGKEKQRRQKC
jgi:hypothetical protein